MRLNWGGQLWLYPFFVVTPIDFYILPHTHTDRHRPSPIGWLYESDLFNLLIRLLGWRKLFLIIFCDVVYYFLYFRNITQNIKKQNFLAAPDQISFFPLWLCTYRMNNPMQWLICEATPNSHQVGLLTAFFLMTRRSISPPFSLSFTLEPKRYTSASGKYFFIDCLKNITCSLFTLNF